MQFYRCRCGEQKAWTSMGVPACSRCQKCGSDLAFSSETHREPEPHKWTTRYEPTTGAPFEVCTTCYRRRAEVIIYDLQERLRLERELAAAYAHDRSEQYTDKSSAKVALEDLAAALLVGEHIEADKHGELDDMVAHHKRFAPKRKK